MAVPSGKGSDALYSQGRSRRRQPASFANLYLPPGDDGLSFSVGSTPLAAQSGWSRGGHNIKPATVRRRQGERSAYWISPGKPLNGRAPPEMVMALARLVGWFDLTGLRLIVEQQFSVQTRWALGAVCWPG